MALINIQTYMMAIAILKKYVKDILKQPSSPQEVDFVPS